jgi:hypothetical protein
LGTKVDERSAADEARRSETPLERAAASALEGLSSIPALGLLAMGAAILELVLARVVWHGLAEILPDEQLFAIGKIARFPRNLAAIAGILALAVALFGFVRYPGYAAIGRRLAVAAFSGVFMPSVLVAAALPERMLKPRLVIFGLAAANVLVTLIGMTAVRYRADRPLRVAVGLASAGSFLTLATVGIGQLALVEGGFWGAVSRMLGRDTPTLQRILLALTHTGELCWLAVLICVAIVALWDRGRPGARSRIAIGVALVLLFFVGLLAIQAMTGYRYRFLLFGSFRLGLAVDDAPVLYALPLAIGIAGAIAALARRDPTMRQVGAGGALWLAAGFAPHTPIQLLYLVLAAALLTRAAQARDPVGAWRARHPWSRWASFTFRRDNETEVERPELPKAEGSSAE